MIDCTDLDRSSRFWSGLLQLSETGRFEEYRFFEDVLPGCRLVLQQVAEVTADKSPIHFDLQPVDHVSFVDRALQLGGTLVAEVENEAYGLVVLGDPDGNEFCVNRRMSGLLENPAR